MGFEAARSVISCSESSIFRSQTSASEMKEVPKKGARILSWLDSVEHLKTLK
jgi:hypothetical protein